MNTFEQDFEKGKIGENKVLDFLLKNKKTKSIIDVRYDKYFQDIDIDFIRETIDNKIQKLEIKTDLKAHKTGNLAYEFISNKYINSTGCYEKTEADYILYFLFETNILYIIKTNLLKEFVKTNDFKQIEMGNNALGFLIKLDLLEKNKIAWKIAI